MQCTNQSYEMIFILNNFLNKGISRQNCEVAADSSYSWKVSWVREEYSGQNMEIYIYSEQKQNTNSKKIKIQFFLSDFFCSKLLVCPSLGKSCPASPLFLLTGRKSSKLESKDMSKTNKLSSLLAYPRFLPDTNRSFRSKV